MRTHLPILPVTLSGLLFVLAGAAYSFFGLLPRAVRSLTAYATSQGMTLIPGPDHHSKVAVLCLAYGLLCALPVAIVALHRLGLLSHQSLARMRFYTMTGILVIAALISPVLSLNDFLLFTGPVLLLNEACIWVVWYLEKLRARETEPLG